MSQNLWASFQTLLQQHLVIAHLNQRLMWTFVYRHSSPQVQPKGHVNFCLQAESCDSSPQPKGHVNFCLQAESCHSSPQPKGHVNFCHHLSVVVNCLKNLFLWNHWANMNQLKFWILSCFTYVLTFSLDFKIRLKTRWEITGSWDPLFSLIKYVSLLSIVVLSIFYYD